MKKDPSFLRHVYHPTTGEFDALVRDCTVNELREKFAGLKRLTPSQLRNLVGSADRLMSAVVNDPSFQPRCRGGLDFATILRPGSKLIVEGGDAPDDPKRSIIGAIVLLLIEHARRRPRPYPIIRVRIDEAITARLVGGPELRAIATSRKYGLFFDFLSQDFNYPGGAEAVLQNCKRHEYFGMGNYDLARKAATDLVAGLPSNGSDRSHRIAEIADDLTMMAPGWRYVRDPAGTRKEYVPMLENGWPDWGNLRAIKLREKLCRIYTRPEYRTSGRPNTGGPETQPSSTSSPSSPPRPPSSPPFSAADRWRQG
jgi:hypothetical protein